jgi:hypothetical protein
MPKPPFAVHAAAGQDPDFFGIPKGDLNGSWVRTGTGIQTLGPDYFSALSQALSGAVDIWG